MTGQSSRITSFQGNKKEGEKKRDPSVFMCLQNRKTNQSVVNASSERYSMTAWGYSYKDPFDALT
jgi:hypothetical protein